MIHLNDPRINEFFFKPDVMPATFFKQAELDMYGQKFLEAVIPRIQRTAKEILDKQQAPKRVTSTSKGLGITEYAHHAGDKMPKSAPGRQQEFLTIQTKGDHPSYAYEATAVSNNISQRAPLPPTRTPLGSTVSPAQARIADNVSNEAQFAPDQQLHQRQRGNSGSKRAINRSGSFHSRMSRPFNDRDHSQQPFSSPAYGPQPALAYVHPRGPSGAPTSSMYSVPQGQTMPGIPPQMQYIPSHFGPEGGMPHPSTLHQNLFNGQQPIYYSANTFRDHMSTQPRRRGFSGEQYTPVFDESYGMGGGHRRNSQGSRGGKSKNFNTKRGRGGPGRNSFTAHTTPHQPPLFAQGVNMNQRPHTDFYGSGAPFGGRRGSVIGEKNWRSRSDHPQIQRNDHALKENVAPGREHSAPGYYAPMSTAQGNFESDMRSLSQSKPTPQTSFDAPAFHSVVPSHTASKEYLQRAAEMQPLSPEKACGMDWIGADCTFATKLVAFNVPLDLSEEEIMQLLSQYGRVKEAKRQPGPLTQAELSRGARLVFLQFHNHVDARQFLDAKPSQWLDNRPLRIEVSREYWDPSHRRFKFHQPVIAGSRVGFDGRIDFAEMADVQHVPLILQRTEDSDSTPRGGLMERMNTNDPQSGDTTPTPSGQSTPKKKSKYTKSKNKKRAENLRKASLATAIDSKLPSEKDDENSDVASAVTTVNDAEKKKIDVSDDVNTQPPSDVSEVQSRRSDTDQTGTQTLYEPTFTPTENIQARLPVPESDRVVEEAQPEFTGHQASRGEEPAASTTFESKVPLIVNSTTDLPPKDEQDSVIAREDRKMQKEVQADNKDEQVADATSTTVVNPPTTAVETPSKSEVDHGDDSFHTASGSPDSVSAMNNHDARTMAETESMPLMTTGAQQADTALVSERTTDLAQHDSHASQEGSESSTSPNINKKVYIPQPTSKPKVALSTAGLDTKSEGTQSEIRSTSGSGNIPQTPMFVTAPNTPAVLQEASREEISQAPAPPSKKDEKPKGPAQTESLSLFGKKKEKKSKPKKGTLKGKPSQREMSDLGSGTSSRVVSGSVTPNNGATGEGLQNIVGLEGGDDVLRSDSKFQDSRGKQSKVKQKQGAKTKGAEDADAPVVPQAETPSKRARNKLGNILSGIFGVNQQSQASAKSTKPGVVTSPKKMKTDTKYHEMLQGSEAKKVDQVVADPKLSGTTVEGREGEGSVDIIPSLSPDDLDPVSAFTQTGKGTLPDSALEHGAEDEIGLGISTITAGQFADEEIKPTKKKKIVMLGGNTKVSDADTAEVLDHSIPATPSQAPSGMFHFRANDAPTSSHDDNQSDASSHTIPEDKVSSATQSPAMSTPAKKFASRLTGNGHLVEAKQPGWKNRKRVPSSKTPETNVDDEVTLYVSRLHDSSDASEQASESGNATPSSEDGSKRPKKIFVYVGASLRDEVENSKAEDSIYDDRAKERMRKLADDELKRKHGIAQASSTTAD